MRRQTIALLVILAALPLHAGGAQIIRSGRLSMGEPKYWISGGAGLQQGWTVVDGTTGVRWQLSDAPSYGASLDRTITGGTSVSLRGSMARVPLDYLPFQAGGGSAEADATVSQAFAGIHVSSGREFHSVLELGAGATIYSGFKSRGVGGATLAPESPDADFTFVFGYGIGYSFSRGLQVDVVQDLATSLHQKTNLTAGESSSARISATRLVVRYGFGS